MNRQTCLHNKVVDYKIIRSAKAKRLRLAVYCDGSFVVTLPKNFSESKIEKYLISKSQWIISKLDFFKKLNEKQQIPTEKNGLNVYKKDALDLVNKRLKYFNAKFYNYKFNQIKIKNQKTLWGSCSKRGNLNFNYKIIFLTPKVRDYIIVHELCHIKELNHSRKFWNLVSIAIPNYPKIVNEVRNKGLDLI